MRSHKQGTTNKGQIGNKNRQVVTNEQQREINIGKSQANMKEIFEFIFA